MSLRLVQTISPAMEYIPLEKDCYPVAPPYWSEEEGYCYNGYLIACPRKYRQETTSLSHFFYEPSSDTIRIILISTVTWWPGWDASIYIFNAETGEWLNRAEVFAHTAGVGIWGTSWTAHVSLGSYNKIYASMNTDLRILEVDPTTLNEITGGWSVNPNADPWNPHTTNLRMAVVNRIDQIIAGTAGATLDCWEKIESTPEKFASLAMVGQPSYLCWENRNYLWTIGGDGTISKIDYKVPRYEMISSVQNPEITSTGYRIAFDTKRKRVVVFRAMPNAEDGTCQHQLEFYYPMVNATYLTAPVPIRSLRAGGKIQFVSHLRGDAGEGVTPYTVNAELINDVHGYLVSPFAGTELNGRVTHGYQAPDEPAADTIQLTATVDEEPS